VFNTRIPLRAVIVTGIYPPDIGGPATHAHDLARAMRDRGHDVTVLTVGDGRAATRDDGVVAFARSAPWFVRMVRVARWLVRHRASFDVVYATGMQLPAVIGARLARRPVVVKVVGDPAWERGYRLGLTTFAFDEFQSRTPDSPRLRLMVGARNWWTRRANAVVTPSAYLQRVVRGWVDDERPVVVVPNGVRRAAVDAHGSTTAPGGTLRCTFVGRLIAAKRVDVLIDAVARVPGATLTVVGDGPALPELEAHAAATGAPVAFLGALAHDAALDTIASSDVFVSATEYEGLPHTMIEALVSGVPVVTSPVGGNEEVVVDGHNGRVVDPPTAERFATVLAQLRDDRDALTKLQHGARESAPQWEFSRCADRLVALFDRVARRPRAVFFGAGAQRHPSGGRKEQVLERYLDPVYVARGAGSATRLQRLRFYAFGSVAALTRASGRRPGVVVCQSPYEAAMVTCVAAMVPSRLRPRVVVEVHGDWRAASRLYGSATRRFVAPVTDRMAAWAVRRADRVRVVGSFTRRLVEDCGYRGEIDVYPAFTDYGMFLHDDAVMPPGEPTVLFVGTFARVKGVDVLLDAWPDIARQVPTARLRLVGDGPLRAPFERRYATRSDIEFVGTVGAPALSSLLDACSLLVLPSRTEGLGRVLLEAFARGRPVVASRVGGVTEVVTDSVTGLLVEPNDPDALARAVVSLLRDRELAARLGEGARRAAVERDPAAEFEGGVAALAKWAAP
jgi:glycosyltransferase involved in cell wall biosynthesis